MARRDREKRVKLVVKSTGQGTLGCNVLYERVDVFFQVQCTSQTPSNVASLHTQE